ncbi:GNAT family N-acetyltransferase [Undibacterium sp. FT79W]|jgi:RimJ/RimL family protein N-acetyltransferase|uniref:GNAT family N-acetyltransferase n=2 Tax=Oxalobacteraceae TaxID=75682 RepID=A0ABR6XGQ1_9BURK|nr:MULTISPECIES: GNAT family protein [Undibacterium]MBC3812036.1 GNAT family N-acetyltransferase [Undibacterium aquatile]MBC3876737.1 GNAT family N-acetyltransferase [Undibacterium sp. FT79W]MBC3927548.1 GNAT family N-acetyltransferase [Undibacterium sp. CY21W]
MECQPLHLQGTSVSLEPLEQAHIADIRNAAADGELWKLFFTSVPAPEQTQQWLDTALAMQSQQKAIPFVVREKSGGKIVGSTRFCNIDHQHQRLEIGYTWYSQSVQRSAINTECKLLLLTHAFEVLNCIAVEFRTDWFNRRSQAAIERLGAKRDGVLRNHMILPDGRIRDTVVYSILQNEWPGLKKNLQYMQNKY